MTNVLTPISFSGGVKSISDDDLCSNCRQCDYQTGEMSGCKLGWPGHEDPDGYVQECAKFEAPNQLKTPNPAEWEKVSRDELKAVDADLARRSICYNGCTNDELRSIYGEDNIQHIRGDGWYRRINVKTS